MSVSLDPALVIKGRHTLFLKSEVSNSVINKINNASQMCKVSGRMMKSLPVRRQIRCKTSTLEISVYSQFVALGHCIRQQVRLHVLGIPFNRHSHGYNTGDMAVFNRRAVRTVDDCNSHVPSFHIRTGVDSLSR